MGRTRVAAVGDTQPANVDEFVSPVESLLNTFDRYVVVDEKDIPTAYKKLVDALQVGDGRHEHGHLVVALDAAESNFRSASNLFMTARVVRKSWELNMESINAKLRNEATAALSQEKAEGKRSKQITEGDITATVATMFADEWRSQEERRIRLSAMEDSLQNLVDAWGSRCRTLQAMLTKSR